MPRHKGQGQGFIGQGRGSHFIDDSLPPGANPVVRVWTAVTHPFDFIYRINSSIPAFFGGNFVKWAVVGMIIALLYYAIWTHHDVKALEKANRDLEFHRKGCDSFGEWDPNLEMSKFDHDGDDDDNDDDESFGWTCRGGDISGRSFSPASCHINKESIGRLHEIADYHSIPAEPDLTLLSEEELGEFTSTPLIWGKYEYYATSSGYIVCLERSTEDDNGKKLVWKKHVSDYFDFSSIHYVDTTLTMWTHDDDDNDASKDDNDSFLVFATTISSQAAFEAACLGDEDDICNSPENGAWTIKAFAKDGELASKIRVDAHPLAVVETNGVVYGNHFWSGVSSMENAVADDQAYTFSFVGKMFCIDLRPNGDKTGLAIEWIEPTIDPTSETLGFYGAPVTSINVVMLPEEGDNGIVYYGTGSLTTMPADTSDCLNDAYFYGPYLVDMCVDAGVHENSLFGMDMQLGTTVWVEKFDTDQHDAWNPSCFDGTAHPNCDMAFGPNGGFSGSLMLDTIGNDDDHMVLIAGQNTGAVWFVEADTGAVYRRAQAGPGGTYGGVGGMCTDGENVYAAVINSGGGNTVFDNSFTETTIKPFPMAFPDYTKLYGGAWVKIDEDNAKVKGHFMVPNANPNPLPHFSFVCACDVDDVACIEEFCGFLFSDIIEDAGLPRPGPPSCVGGLIVAGISDREGSAYFIDTNDMEKVWSFSTGGPVVAAPTISGNVVTVPSRSDKVFSLALVDR